jgi:uncharacterized protein YdhG (YjbR/CyaY superfamily)
MAAKQRYASHDEYFASVPPEVRPLLAGVQSAIEAVVPEASRCISYNIPAYRLERVFIYFAAFKRHIGVYPPVRSDAGLVEALARYRGEKGNLVFPFDEPMPWDLIRRVAAALAQQSREA